MKSTLIPIEYQYTRRDLLRLFAFANEHDVEKGGRYDARAAAINVWTHSWVNKATRGESSTMGTFYVYWAEENEIYQIELDEGFSLEDLRKELGVLEEKALGRKIHGV